MPFTETPISGLLVFEPRVFSDDRGYFFESFNEQTFAEAGITRPFVQDNQSRSVYGVVRGLHYQLAPMAQAKLVRVVEGEVLDVAVDIRQGSPTFGQHFSILLSKENKKQLYLPRGFAHGFSVLSEYAEFVYKCDNFYSGGHDAGIRFDDPALGIDWKLPADDVLLSGKDAALPLFADAKNNFTEEGTAL
ncbi:MAG: dTDP-4-dehydrorhamnose 3,5-epimerase [Chitinophagales bacterium]|nr:dTDP-4-dehydrorhamnose 3,5-epimerase [Chitinophagales bacterium]HAE14789.1 dTDP-4-dehydrorhamnose 3,5-epimerase [Bacteroidota bacterium]MCB9021704.1 dTDP-4-dehydrorhamnose 3,5-epimerase [Chitinophagales bacterium]MCB9031045.1 dTDP-4-dehydrorhamnose 3,5-epimerase [Chitinophagales bacterium]HAE34368.1 dTDP-4-dehydrorhamnose 3,5-epimerase [Bacteroidota bacterium]